MAEQAAPGTTERYATLLGGTALAVAGLRRGGVVGAVLAAAGGGLAVAGAMGTSLPQAGRWAGAMVASGPRKTQANVTIGCDAERLYRYWRNVAHLPKLFSHIDTVEIEDDRRSVWTAHIPGGGLIRWRSEIDDEKEFERIAWRTLGETDFDHQGSVHFVPAPGGRGTIVRLTLSFRAPGGKAGRAFAKLLGTDPEQEARRALSRFKQLMETGEIATIDGQPRGDRGVREWVES